MAKLLISEFTEQITFLNSVVTTDAGGGVINTISATGVTVWAKVETLGNSQNQNESMTNDLVSYKATIRDWADISWNTKMVARWNFNNFNITSFKKKKIGTFEYLELNFVHINNG